MKKQTIIFWTAILLAAFAILDGLFLRGGIHMSSILVPVLIFGIVFLLYKFPPKKYRKNNAKVKVKPSARTMAKVSAERRNSTNTTTKRKHYPFQVIDGQKGKNDDDYPKYH